MHKPYSRLLSTTSRALLAIGVLSLLACASKPTIAPSDLAEPAWVSEVVNYRHTLAVDHPDNIGSMFALAPTTKDLVRSKFGEMPKYRAIRKLADWLSDEQGQAMRYDVDANLSPAEAFTERRGNCLSFTLLLSALAAELDIQIDFNEVDIPDVWGFDAQTGLISYRHVNGIYRGSVKKQVFDLAIANYRLEYPQRVISREHALAKLHSNRAVQQLSERPSDQVLHSIKLAVSFAPHSSELWLNLGVVYKRLEQLDRAEFAYLKGLQLDPNSAMAASNLERLYRAQGRKREASKYRKLAEVARKQNPYFHFNVAQHHFKQQSLRKAKNAIGNAIRLHSKDARFYELRSRISQLQFRWVSALKDLEKAYKVTEESSERNRYALKAQLMVDRAVEQEEKRKRNSNRSNNQRFMDRRQ